MREQEVRNLWEAYLEVCENQQLDEVSNEKVAAVSKARKKNVNKAFDELDDTRGSSQNLATAISKQQKNQRLSAKRDKRNEEFENWVNSLIEEGYDLSEYTWDDMYEMYVTEGANYDRNRQ